jgi:hypothetical protein
VRGRAYCPLGGHPRHSSGAWLVLDDDRYRWHWLGGAACTGLPKRVSVGRGNYEVKRAGRPRSQVVAP